MMRTIAVLAPLLWMSATSSHAGPGSNVSRSVGPPPVTTSYVGDTTNGPVWRRPADGAPPTSLSQFPNAPFQVREIEILEAGLYTVSAAWNNWDGFLCLYSSPFNCVDQLTNVLACNDDGLPVGSQVIVNLPAGKHVVVATAFSTASGSYVIDIVGPGAVALLGEPGGACVLGSLCGNGVVDPGEECDDGNSIDDDDCSNQCLLPPHLLEPGIGLNKTLTGGEPYTQPGDVLEFALVAHNSGNAILADVLVDDPLIATLACNPVQPATLGPDEQMICVADYTVTADDMARGSFTNLAMAGGVARDTLNVDAIDSATAVGGCEFVGCELHSDGFEPIPPFFIGSAMLKAFVGVAFSHRIEVGGSAPVLLQTGPLPGWLDWVDDDTLLGTPGPSDVGVVEIEVSATNSGGSALQVFTLEVAPDPVIRLIDQPLLESFAGGLPDGWQAGGDWAVGAPATGGTGTATFPGAPFAGTCAGTVLQDNYRNRNVAKGFDGLSILETQVLDFTGVVEPQWRFHHFMHAESGFDGGNLKISLEGGAEGTFVVIPSTALLAGSRAYNTGGGGFASGNPLAAQQGWTGFLTSSPGVDDGWEEIAVSLEALFGAAPRDAVVLRWEFGADATVTRPGWYVDDVRIGAALDLPLRPNIISQPVLSVIEGESYSYSVVATGQPMPTLSAIGLPPGISLDAEQALISGVPTQLGSFAVTLTAINAAERGEAVQVFELVVLPDGTTPPVITSTDQASATAGISFSFVITAEGTPTPAISVSALPDWLEFDGVDTLSGPPDAFDLGTVAVQVMAENPAGVSEQLLTIEVAPAAAIDLSIAPLVEGFGTSLPAGWAASGQWEFGAPATGGNFPPAAFDGDCAATILLGNYGANAFSRLQTPVLDLSAVTDPQLRFHHFFRFEGTFQGAIVDGGNLLLSSDGGRSFSVLGDSALLAGTGYLPGFLFRAGDPNKAGQPAWAGLIPGADWEEVVVDLALALGAQPRDQVVVRFEMASDSSVQLPGWYVDQVMVGANASLPALRAQQ